MKKLIPLALWVAVMVPAGASEAQVTCLRRNGPFAWNCAGPVAGMVCTQILETADPNTWSDNYFCASSPLGIRWNSAGPIPGMECTHIHEPADPHTWDDNYLCLPPNGPFELRWSSAGPLRGMQCLQWIEPSDPHTWTDNYLCYARRPMVAPPPVIGIPVPPGPIRPQPFPSPPLVMVAPPPVVGVPVPPAEPGCVHRSGPFAWSCAGPLPGMRCTQIVETADPHTWGDNYFCSSLDFGIRWNSAGPIPGMRCTQILELADPDTWTDNYLCVPPGAPVRFAWNSAGPIPGLTCLQWEEPSDPHTWRDNYLCW